MSPFWNEGAGGWGPGRAGVPEFKSKEARNIKCLIKIEQGEEPTLTERQSPSDDEFSQSPGMQRRRKDKQIPLTIANNFLAWATQIPNLSTPKMGKVKTTSSIHGSNQERCQAWRTPGADHTDLQRWNYKWKWIHNSCTLQIKTRKTSMRLKSRFKKVFFNKTLHTSVKTVSPTMGKWCWVGQFGNGATNLKLAEELKPYPIWADSFHSRLGTIPSLRKPGSLPRLCFCSRLGDGRGGWKCLGSWLLSQSLLSSKGLSWIS